MESRRIKKLSRAATAAILGVSSVAVGMPQPAQAKSFKDLDPNADYYKPVLDLANRGVINGYSDGTFKPHNSVTRGQAAKMLALALKLDTSNVRNPGFKDVQPGNELYPYIAALSNKGIITGYSDGTYKPNQPITRAEVARALALGYNFEIASELENDFKDVPSTNSYAYYIQTLVNLNITKGSTPTEFKPFAPVTRGQMATFIVRSENADANPVYKVGKIEGNKVYINSVPYSVDPSLTSIFNSSNQAVLEGAIIEGHIEGNSLKSLSKLTLTSSGTDSNKLVFDGRNSTYNGQLIVQGSYIEFKNWTLNGTVILAENVKKKLGKNRLNKVQIASIQGFGFIDWNKPTEPEVDESLNPVEEQELKETPKNSSNKKKKAPPMPSIEKYVDFTNCYVNRLIIEQNRTYVAAKNKINSVTVQGYVEQFELFANVETMYLQPETSVAMYGKTDIKRLYKNGYYNVQFKSDSYVDELIIDNDSGWIDLEENFYVGKVILPKGTYPRNVFDDFENDKGRLPNIEDEDGNKVEDPIDDIIIPDRTPPVVVDALTVTADSTTAIGSFTANEKGYYYYIVQEVGGDEPSIRDLLTRGIRGETNEANQRTYFTIENLQEQTEYEIYLVVVDYSDNVSYKEYETFTTTDGTPPTVTATAEALYGGQRVQLNLRASEPGEFYYFYRYKSDTAPLPSTDDVLTRHQGSGTIENASELYTHIIEGLEPETEYEIFIIMKDKSGNFSTQPTRVEVKTTELDDVHPFVIDPALHPIPNTNDFEIYFSERLEKDTAEDINNYDLSGTGIINVSGQEVIKPTNAVYEELPNGRSKVTLTIPSKTGFVHGDTLRVTVLPGVKDLAGNEFVNASVVGEHDEIFNYADYLHGDEIPPVLIINDVLPGGLKFEVNFNASEAGTYYYMIMPEDFVIEEKDIDPRDFVDELTGKSTGKFLNENNNPAYLHAEGGHPALRGDQKYVIDLEEGYTIDPFKSYYLYMVMRDRSGNLSTIVKKPEPIIADSRPPIIQNVDVSVTTGDDTKVKVSFNSNEKGTVYVIPFEKEVLAQRGLYSNGTYLPLPGTNVGSYTERKEHFFNSGGTVKQNVMSQGANTITIDNLKPHTEYGFYIGVEDTFGNFTIEEVFYTGSGSPGSRNMIKNVYTDGTQPIIDPVIKKLTRHEFNDLATTADTAKFTFDKAFYTITFSEAISLTSENSDIPLDQNDVAVLEELKSNLQVILGTTVEDIFWQDLQGVQTYQPRKVIFMVDNPITTDFAVDMNSNYFNKFVDLANHKFNALGSVAEYNVPERDNKITSVDLQYDPLFPYNTKVSRELHVTTELNVTLSWNQKYYYAVVTSDYELSNEDIDEVIRRSDRNIEDLTDFISIISYGSGDLKQPSDLSSVKVLKAIQRPGFDPTNLDTVNVFAENQKIYLFTKDQYGNIIFANDGNNPGVNYVVIEQRQN